MVSRALPPDYLKNALERIDLKLLCNWILTGGETSPTSLDYNQRLVEGCKEIEDLIKTTFADTKQKEQALDYLSEAIGSYSDVYVEIGAQIGAHLIVQLLNNKEIGS